MKLSQLPKGVEARVTEVGFMPMVQQRLAQLGVMIGETICVVRPSVAKSPLMVRTQGAYLMVRYQDAQHIMVG